MNSLLDLIGEFTWSFGQSFHIETETNGCFEWSDPDYGGDNTIRRCGSYGEWLEEQNIEFGRSKGKHKIRDYCGENVRFVDS